MSAKKQRSFRPREEVDPPPEPWRDRLNTLRSLSENWDSNGAQPPNSLALAHLEKILSLLPLSDLIPAQISASAEGGAAISFLGADQYADIECFNDGDILAVTSIGRAVPDVWEVSPDNLFDALSKIRDFLSA